MWPIIDGLISLPLMENLINYVWGSRKADSHTACRAHAVPLPCRAAKGSECVFPIWFAQYGRVWFTLVMPMPCSDHAVLFKATAQDGRWETACVRPARIRLLPDTTRSSTKVVIRSIPISDAFGLFETKQRRTQHYRSMVGARPGVGTVRYVNRP